MVETLLMMLIRLTGGRLAEVFFGIGYDGKAWQSRHYSLYLALQLKARMEGIQTPIYGLQEVHHLS
jgi:hypothetical protein